MTASTSATLHEFVSYLAASLRKDYGPATVVGVTLPRLSPRPTTARRASAKKARAA